MSDLTTNRNDPRLGHGVDPGPVPQQEAYLILSDKERAKGLIRPLRLSYIHRRDTTGIKDPCGAVTVMSEEIAETYARDPKFYGSTYCVRCSRHLPVADFDWDGYPPEVVGS